MILPPITNNEVNRNWVINSQPSAEVEVSHPVSLGNLNTTVQFFTSSNDFHLFNDSSTIPGKSGVLSFTNGSTAS